MMRIVLAIAALGLAAACSASSTGNGKGGGARSSATHVTLTAADGVKVYGDYYEVPHPKALILLFHQARSSAAEYATIAPRLNAMGYSALAIDQRSGGDMFGPNRTVRALGTSQDYMAAEQDLRAALDWAVAKRQPVMVWGSSYSAALIFLLAADNPGKIKALLAFSPGEYLPDKHAVENAAASLDLPVFIAAQPDTGETKAARQIYDALGHRPPPSTLYLPQHGVHGSSTLIAGRDPQGAAQNWQAVQRFLQAVSG
ncbi:MAG: alpha/beta hydrolase [Sphingomonas sp.]